MGKCAKEQILDTDIGMKYWCHLIKGGKVDARRMVGKGGNHIYTPVSFLPRKVLFHFKITPLPFQMYPPKTKLLSAAPSPLTSANQNLSHLSLYNRVGQSLFCFSDQSYLVPSFFAIPSGFLFVWLPLQRLKREMQAIYGKENLTLYMPPKEFPWIITEMYMKMPFILL